ncbi:MAG: archaellin/type IV pilin N-terminal domain-containing protein [Acidilobus sp.]
MLRRSISDIVAVVLLIVIAIAAAVIIYMWLSGLIGAVHTTSSSTLVTKLEITGASVSVSKGITVDVLNPTGSATAAVVSVEVESTNGTLICSSPVSPATTVTPGGTASIKESSCSGLTSNYVGLPVEVVAVTDTGYQASYQTVVTS